MGSSRHSSWSVKLGPPRGGAGRPGFSLTWAGGVFFATMLLIGVAAVNASVNLLFLILGMAGGLLWMSGLVARASLRKMHVTREAPEAVVAGRPFTVRYRLHNRRAFGDALAVRISEEAGVGAGRLRLEGYVACIPANSVVTLDIELAASVRGALKFRTIRVLSRFPFGLFERRLTISAPHETSVYPALLPLRRRLDAGRAKAAWQAMAGREKRHGKDEFYGLREYRHGESLRWVHWRSSARTGDLLVREMVDVLPQTTVVVLDTYLPPDEPAEHLETAISAAATLVCHALEVGFKAGLVVLARETIVSPPASGRGLRSRMMSRLAFVEEPSTAPGDAVLAEQRWPGHWRGRCFLIAPVPHHGLWRTANILRARSSSVEVIAADGAEFSSWFGPPGERSTEKPSHAPGVPA